MTNGELRIAIATAELERLREIEARAKQLEAALIESDATNEKAAEVWCAIQHILYGEATDAE